ncbi:MAG TPA: gluconate 2-dehydrogenase subunit 3 family protein [Alphaproteobacteria bacterium]|nr:gluconate 2-dehydrogenase subunit 3 family protein [Alphaproteobacteria bacterium]
MTERFPGYDVLAKRHSPSWNEKTRRVIDTRLAAPREPRFFTAAEFRTLEAICGRILPQPARRPPVPIGAMIDAKLFEGRGDGYRDSRLPPAGEAWRLSLAAFDAEARERYGCDFDAIDPAEQDSLLQAAQNGELSNAAWRGMDSALLFSKQILLDVVMSYYGHPTAWSEIGFGGPASPRGYVRMDFDRRDPWEAAEAKPGREAQTRKANARIG